MDFDRASSFLAGLLVGNTLHTWTTLILFGVWLVVNDVPLPDYLGGHSCQQILKGFIYHIQYKFFKKTLTENPNPIPNSSNPIPNSSNPIPNSSNPIPNSSPPIRLITKNS